jgi:hypothetical protein
MPKSSEERYSLARTAFAAAFRDFFDAEGYKRFREQTSFALEHFECRRTDGIRFKTAALCRNLACDHCANNEPIFLGTITLTPFAVSTKSFG